MKVGLNAFSKDEDLSTPAFRGAFNLMKAFIFLNHVSQSCQFFIYFWIVQKKEFPKRFLIQGRWIDFIESLNKLNS